MQSLGGINKSPATEIATELLSIIFRFCIAGPILIPPNISEPPWTLTHVCSRWRNVAVDIPELWSRLHFDLGNHNQFLSRIECGRTLVQRRTGTYPLAVRNQNQSG